jgi:hypothetical protein
MKTKNETTKYVKENKNQRREHGKMWGEKWQTLKTVNSNVNEFRTKKKIIEKNLTKEDSHNILLISWRWFGRKGSKLKHMWAKNKHRKFKEWQKYDEEKGKEESTNVWNI